MALQNCGKNEVVVCRVNDDTVYVTKQEDIEKLEEIGYKILAAH
ncbi:hypothetical protein [Fictibacillus macauensis]|nr:hypothetical protein [Fictibacillus macauensis]